MLALYEKLRQIPDFPKKGILFYDLTPVMQDAQLFAQVIDALAKPYEGKNIQTFCGIESRGFIFAATLAKKLNAGFVPIRKKGKLPWKTYQETYDLEYGQDTLEIHQDEFKDQGRVVLVDDLLATGGTAKAAQTLIEKAKGDLYALSVVLELQGLEGRSKLKETPIHTLLAV